MSLMLERDDDTRDITSRDGKARLRIIDCDIHPYLRSPRDLDPFLTARWLAVSLRCVIPCAQ